MAKDCAYHEYCLKDVEGNRVLVELWNPPLPPHGACGLHVEVVGGHVRQPAGEGPGEKPVQDCTN